MSSIAENAVFSILIFRVIGHPIDNANGLCLKDFLVHKERGSRF